MANGTIFEDSSKTPKDMKKLIDVLTVIEGRTSALAEDEHTIATSFRRWSNGSIPSAPNVTDMKNYVGNLGLAIPAGFLMIHNDLAKLSAPIGNSNFTASSSMSAGDLFGTLLKGIGLGAVGAVAIEKLGVSIGFAKNVITATVPEQFNTLLAEIAMMKYFEDAGFEVDIDTEGKITDIRRKPTTKIDEYISYFERGGEALTTFIGTMMNPTALKLKGLFSSISKGIEDLSTAVKFASEIIQADIPEDFNTLLAQMSLMKYFDNAGFEVDLNPDGTVKAIRHKQMSEDEKKLSLLERAMNDATNFVAVAANPFAIAVTGISSAISGGIEKLSTSAKFASKILQAEIPEQFNTLLAEVQLAGYFEKAGYSVEINEKGEITSIGIKDKSAVMKALDFVGDTVDGIMKVAFKPLTSLINIGADTVQDIQLGAKLNDAAVRIYETSMKDILALSDEDKKSYKQSFTKSMSSFFDNLSSAFENNKGELPRGIKGNLLENLNNAYLEAVNSSLNDINIMDNSTRTIVSSFDDSNLRKDTATIIQKLIGIRDGITDLLKKDPVVMNNQPSGPVANADLNAV